MNALVMPRVNLIKKVADVGKVERKFATRLQKKKTRELDATVKSFGVFVFFVFVAYTGIIVSRGF